MRKFFTSKMKAEQRFRLNRLAAELVTIGRFHPFCQTPQPIFLDEMDAPNPMIVKFHNAMQIR